MPRMDRTGPEGRGCGTGRKLGFCPDLTSEKNPAFLGYGMGMHRHTPDRNMPGKAKRLRYNQEK